MDLSHLPRFDGNKRGSAGVSYLQAFEAFVALRKWGTASETLYKQLWVLSFGAVPDSAFDFWSRQHIRPLALRIQTAVATCVTAADHQVVLTQYQPLYSQVIALFRQQFCVADAQEYGTLMTELAQTSAQHVGVAVWRPLILVLQRLQEFHRQPLPSSVPSECDFVSQLLDTSVVVPEVISLRLKAVVDGLTQNQLPAVPANAPADHNPRLTLAAVITAVSQLADQLDHAVGWTKSRSPLAPGVSGMVAAPVVSQQSALSAVTSHMQARGPTALAASMAASLRHLSAGQRCQLVFKAFPDALCPEHCMLHAMKACPLVLADGNADCERLQSQLQ